MDVLKRAVSWPSRQGPNVPEFQAGGGREDTPTEDGRRFSVPQTPDGSVVDSSDPTASFSVPSPKKTAMRQYVVHDVGAGASRTRSHRHSGSKSRPRSLSRSRSRTVSQSHGYGHESGNNAIVLNDPLPEQNGTSGDPNSPSTEEPSSPRSPSRRRTSRHRSSFGILSRTKQGRKSDRKIVDLKRFNPVMVLENSGSVARDHLASERTYLAYVRTSLALASTGVALVQLFTIADLTSRSTGVSLSTASRRLQHFARPLGLTMVLLGLIVLTIAVYRYFLIQRALPEKNFPLARFSIVFISFSLGAAVVVIFGALLGGRTIPLHFGKLVYLYGDYSP